MRRRARGWASFIIGAVAVGSAAVALLAQRAEPAGLSMLYDVLVACAVGMLAAALTWILTGTLPEARGFLDWASTVLARGPHRKLAEVVEFLPDATLVLDAKGRLVAWNRAMEQLTGVKASQVLGKDYTVYSLPFYGAPLPLLADLLLEGSSIPERFTEVRELGSAVSAQTFAFMLGESGLHVAGSANLLVDADGHVMGAVESIRDITPIIRTEEVLREKGERMGAVFRSGAVGAVLLSPSGEFTEVNPRWAEMLGYDQDELARMRLSDVAHPDDVVHDNGFIRSLFDSDVDTHHQECRYIRKDGTVFWTDTSFAAVRDSDGQVRTLVGTIVDITDHKRAETELVTLSKTDPLTGLANRRAFEERLEEEWRRALRTHAPLSLLMIDVDWFKEYNDTHGHIEGDRCLRTVAQALSASFQRATDFVARWGGEEFAVIVSNTSQAQAVQDAERIRAAVRDLGIRTGTNETDDVVTISVGVATANPQRHETPAALLRAADDALYEAKTRGRNRVAAGSLRS